MLKGLLWLRVSCLHQGGPTYRGLATAVDKGTLSKLRKRTGISFINCKKALAQFENDIDQAEKWLKEQAQKEGWAKATKLQTRSMSNGLVAVVSDQQAATMIEVNCETDFVARNNKFISLTTSLAHDCHQALLQTSDHSLSLDKAVGSLSLGGGQSLGDRVALEVGNIGENMALRRAVHVKARNSALSAYVHASGPDISTDAGCRLGKYGVILTFDHDPSAQPTSEDEGQDLLPTTELGHVLGQHIVGMNPTSVGSLEEGEEEQKEEVKAEGREEEEKEKGEKEEEVKEEERLVFQEFLLKPGVRVGQLLKTNGATVNAFYRFACGEELPQDEKDTS